MIKRRGRKGAGGRMGDRRWKEKEGRGGGIWDRRWRGNMRRRKRGKG